MNRPRTIHFDWQIILIGLSAVAGLLFAYNWRMAAFQFAIVAISIVLYLLVANLPDPMFRIFVIFCSVVIAAPANAGLHWPQTLTPRVRVWSPRGDADLKDSIDREAAHHRKILEREVRPAPTEQELRCWLWWRVAEIVRRVIETHGKQRGSGLTTNLTRLQGKMDEDRCGPPDGPIGKRASEFERHLEIHPDRQGWARSGVRRSVSAAELVGRALVGYLLPIPRSTEEAAEAAVIFAGNLMRLPDDDPGRAVTQYDLNYGFRVGNRMVVQQPKQPAQTFRIDGSQLVPIADDPELTRDALAHVLWPGEVYRRKLYRLPEAEAIHGPAESARAAATRPSDRRGPGSWKPPPARGRQPREAVVRMMRRAGRPEPRPFFPAG